MVLESKTFEFLKICQFKNFNTELGFFLALMWMNEILIEIVVGGDYCWVLTLVTKKVNAVVTLSRPAGAWASVI